MRSAEEPTTPASGGVRHQQVLQRLHGTSGRPKAAVLTHEGMVSATRAKLEAGLYGDAKTYLHCAPLFHVGGLSSAPRRSRRVRTRVHVQV